MALDDMYIEYIENTCQNLRKMYPYAERYLRSGSYVFVRKLFENALLHPDAVSYAFRYAFCNNKDKLEAIYAELFNAFYKFDDDLMQHLINHTHLYMGLTQPDPEDLELSHEDKLKYIKDFYTLDESDVRKDIMLDSLIKIFPLNFTFSGRPQTERVIKSNYVFDALKQWWEKQIKVALDRVNKLQGE